MLVGINVAMFQSKKNHSHHKFVLIGPTKSTLKQQPTINMGISKNPKPNKKWGKNGWVGEHTIHESFWIHGN